MCGQVLSRLVFLGIRTTGCEIRPPKQQRDSQRVDEKTQNKLQKHQFRLTFRGHMVKISLKLSANREKSKRRISYSVDRVSLSVQCFVRFAASAKSGSYYYVFIRESQHGGLH